MTTLFSAGFFTSQDYIGRYLQPDTDNIKVRNTSDTTNLLDCAAETDNAFIYMPINPSTDSWAGPFAIFSYKNGLCITHDPKSSTGISLAPFADQYEQNCTRATGTEAEGSWSLLVNAYGTANNCCTYDYDKNLDSDEKLLFGTPDRMKAKETATWVFSNAVYDGAPASIHDVPGKLGIIPPDPSDLLVQVDNPQTNSVENIPELSKQDEPATCTLADETDKLIIGETLWEWPFVTGDPEYPPELQVKSCMYYILRRYQYWKKIDDQIFLAGNKSNNYGYTKTTGVRENDHLSLNEAIGISVTKRGGLSFGAIGKGLFGAARHSRAKTTSKRLRCHVSESSDQHESKSAHEGLSLGPTNRVVAWQLVDGYALYRLPCSPGEDAAYPKNFNEHRESYFVTNEECDRDMVVIDQLSDPK